MTLRSMAFLCLLSLYAFASPSQGPSSMLYVPYRDGNMWGLADGGGKLIVSPQFDEIRWSSEGKCWLIRSGEHWGILQEGGRLALAPEYHALKALDNGQILVRMDQRFGVIQKEGEVVIPMAYAAIRLAEDQEHYIVRNEQGQEAIFDQHGEKKLAFQALNILEIAGGVVKLQCGEDQTGFIALDGSEILPCKYGYQSTMAGGVLVLTQRKMCKVELVEDGASNRNKVNFNPKTGLAHVRMPREDLELIQEVDPRSLDSMQVVLQGITDLQGRWILPMDDHWVMPQAGDPATLLVKHGNLYGLFDQSGRKLMETRYQEIGTFSEGLAVFKDRWRVGYVDAEGKVRIPAQFNAGDNFREGIAAVLLGESWGYVNAEGKAITKFVYQEAKPFYEGRAAVKRGGVWGFIDHTGKEVIVPRYFKVEAQHALQGEAICPGFVEGRAKVAVKDSSGKSLRYGFIGLNGEVLVPAVYEQIGEFKQGVARVSEGKEERVGFINGFGELLVPMEYPHAQLQEGFIICQNPEGESYSLFNTQGTLIAAEIQRVSGVSEGRVMVKLGSGGKFRFLDPSGNWLRQEGFVFARPFRNGLAAVFDGDHWGFMDRSGKMIIPPKFEDVGTFENGICRVKAQQQWGYIDQYGKEYF